MLSADGAISTAKPLPATTFVPTPLLRGYNPPAVSKSLAHKSSAAAATVAVPAPLPPRRPATLVLLGAGTLLFAASLLFQDTAAAPALGATLGRGRWAVVLTAAAVASLPIVAARLAALGRRLADPSPRQRALTALAVGVAAFGYLVLTAHLQGRDLFPKTHDDQSYLLQVRMLAAGHLAMPPHPLADFFDTFYVLARPAYASQYFVGAALLYVPTVWLGLPTWVLPAVVAGAIVGLVYRVVAELVDGSAGLLAALLVVSLEYVRVYSVLLTSHEPVLLMGLVSTWAWLRWRGTLNPAGGRAAPPGAAPRGRTDRSWAWAGLIGAISGWAAITRPVDALCVAVPIGLAMLVDLLSTRRDARATAAVASRGSFWRSLSVTAACLVLGASPFLLLQAAANRAATGSLLDTPFSLYARRDMPGVGYGVGGPMPAGGVASVVPQKRDYYDLGVRPYLRRQHDPAILARAWGGVYLPMIADTTLPARPLLAFLPVGLLGLTTRPRWAVAAVLPLFVLAYLPYTFFLEHYALVAVLAVAVLLVLGTRAAAAAVGPRRAGSARSGLTAGLVALCLTVLPEMNPLFGRDHAVGDETFDAPTIRSVRAALDAPGAVRRPAVVLFTYRPGDPVQEEPVYNTFTARPDDAEVVFAHDLGPRNPEIFKYYARHQPDRYFYRWDRQKRDVEELGYARDLGK